VHTISSNEWLHTVKVPLLGVLIKHGCESLYHKFDSAG
jgi:hypothetical protein